MSTLMENHYSCSECGAEWIDIWYTVEYDRCPGCGDEVEPYWSSKIDPESQFQIEGGEKESAFELGKEYRFREIEEWADKNEAFWEESGPETLGKNLIVLMDDNDLDNDDAIASFVLVGATGSDFIYRCCYLEKEKK